MLSFVVVEQQVATESLLIDSLHRLMAGRGTADRKLRNS